MDQFKKLPKKRILESSIESYGVRECKKLGWVCEKFKSENKRSVPDRLVSTNFGTIFFIEFKAPGKKATPLQKKDHDKRRAMGHTVFVCDTKESTDQALAAEALKEFLR